MMSTAELKTNIHSFVDRINDTRFLRVVHAMMKAFIGEQEPTKEEKKLIDERLAHLETHPEQLVSWDDLYSRLRKKSA